MWIIIIIALITLLALLLQHLNKDYFLLSLCKRIKTSDGSDLKQKTFIIPGGTIFGNNFDVLNMNPETIFQYCRNNNKMSKGKSYLLHFLSAVIYNVTNAEDAEAVLQSTTLLKKAVLYELLHPFLGEGLLTSTDEKWHFRRKLLTPAFHFNILQTFLEIFKEESYKLMQVLNSKEGEVISLTEIIPDFTLNNVCETALGVKLDNVAGNKEYRESIHSIELIMIKRLCNPLMFYKIVFYIWGDYYLHQRHVAIAHDFCSKIIQKRREDFQKYLAEHDASKDLFDEFAKKKRYAMLDTLLDAEAKGLIDHQGICDEVNTFMFEGYDTTSTCLIFALFNLAQREDIQQKCFSEIEHLGDMESLTVFDFNKLEYLECVIKETLRLYPSVPFIGRECATETELNGLILPKFGQINVHTFDIMRDERHFPDPLLFDPDRFLPHNTTNRHPFAFVPFSAGPRNCIGQKFAILEIKVLLFAFIKHFVLLPVTRLEDITFENGLVLCTKQQVKIKLSRRVA